MFYSFQHRSNLSCIPRFFFRFLRFRLFSISCLLLPCSFAIPISFLSTYLNVSPPPTQSVEGLPLYNPLCFDVLHVHNITFFDLDEERCFFVLFHMLHPQPCNHAHNTVTSPIAQVMAYDHKFYSSLFLSQYFLGPKFHSYF